MSPIEPDGLPEILARDPSRPPRTLAFTGFVGTSDKDGHVRLYVDEELREWFDIAEQDVLHMERHGEGTLRRTVLWVDERTLLHRRAALPEDLEGRYLDGEIEATTVQQSAMTVALTSSVHLRTPMKSLLC